MPRKFALALLLTMLAVDASAAGSRSKSAEKARAAAEVNVSLGQRYLEQGKLELALEKLQKALEYDASNTNAHTVIAVLYERINDPKRAEQHYRRASELSPKLGAVNNNYGAFLCRSGKLDDAARYFEKALADPFYKTPDVARTNAGTCYLQGERLDPAEQQFRKALEINPTNAEALYQLARVLFQKNDYLRARAFLQRFDALGQASPDALLLGRDIEEKLGNTREANEYTKRLKTEFPDSTQARELESSTPS
ncbi:type IV pilus biogenesis/stability protein PilW [Tahibacter amnicola]|uniref:Type IV pilus biogenesis/stability protein PilW n=1 Tax=Tahibacter amnicola TaxID=2976241 RepID=A0ABY6BAQ2_9GAMM|nr:type IV pilus biogenesis/stability protein PilW [Tahibacter amnicola]UXI66607.1 type IV pilus biogenesis/stability protein PilW [Tahibacter amnicola]